MLISNGRAYDISDHGLEGKHSMTINVESLLADITPEAPCGEDLAYDQAMLLLDNEFRGKPEQQMGDSISEAVEPNWENVKDMAVSLLERSRDLRVIIQLTAALIELEGVEGLKSGLSLLQQSLARHWEHVHPQLDSEDDNDPLERVNIIAAITTPMATIGDPLMFRSRVQALALTESRQLGSFGYRDIIRAQSGAPASEGENDKAASSSEIEAAFQDTELDVLVSIYEGVQQSRETVLTIDSTLTDLVGVGSAANFEGLIEDLKAMEHELGERLRQRGYGVAEEEDAEADGQGGSTGAALSGEVSSPRDAELALGKVIRYYEQQEPSSPVPMLVKVASSMISKSFVEISSVLPPDTVELIIRICSPNEEN